MTGASSGIGAALAQHYGTAGATLGLAARRAPPLQVLAAKLSVPPSIYTLDVADRAALAAAAADFIERHGVPDIVIANAGVSTGTQGRLAEDLDALARIMQVNVLGLAATLQPFVVPMRARGSGALVGIASVAGFRGLAGAGAYSASKAAAITWLESLRVELAGSGVDVVTICPGFVATPMTAANRYPMPFLLCAPEMAKRIAHAIAARRRLAIIPWQMRVVFFFLRRMPNWLFDRLFAHAPRKSRDLQL
ncbi:MAG: SDR family oxidoreductase [Pseudomonadota bacterium]